MFEPLTASERRPFMEPLPDRRERMMGSFRLIYHWKLLDTEPPWSNDPDRNKFMMRIVWNQRNGAAVGRGVMAWAAVCGWSLAAILIVRAIL